MVSEFRASPQTSGGTTVAVRSPHEALWRWWVYSLGCLVGALRLFSHVWRRVFWDALRKSGDDAPVLPVALALGRELLPQRGDQLGWLAG